MSCECPYKNTSVINIHSLPTRSHTEGGRGKHQRLLNHLHASVWKMFACVFKFLPPKPYHTEKTLKTRAIYKTNDYFIQAIVYVSSPLVCVLLCFAGYHVINYCLYTRGTCKYEYLCSNKTKPYTKC